MMISKMIVPLRSQQQNLATQLRGDHIWPLCRLGSTSASWPKRAGEAYHGISNGSRQDGTDGTFTIEYQNIIADPVSIPEKLNHNSVGMVQL